MRKLKKKIGVLTGILTCAVYFAVLLTISVNAKEKNTTVSSLIITDDGQEYGELYGGPYSETDDSQWLTLKLGGRGLRIVNNDNADIVLIDQFGSVYVNGQLCNADSKEEQTGVNTNFSYGFMYFLVVVTLLLGSYNFIRGKRK